MPPKKGQTSLALENNAPKLDFKMNDGQTEPVVWISRLEIWESLDAKEPIRVVNLHRGLNIVWAPDAIPEGAEGEGPPKTITGHCAGKSLFTRLLRYCLGEKSFAPKEVQTAIRDELRSGYVLAQVFLEGTKWAVARPLGHSHRSYAKRDATLTELRTDSDSRSDYDLFEAALDDRLERLPVGAIPGKQNRSITWPMLLAWAARDQYCHFENIHTWRSTRSGSDPLSFEKPKEDPVFLIRLLLGLITGDEVGKEESLAEAKQKLDLLKEQIKEKSREPEYWHNHYRRALHKLLNINADETVPINAEDFFTRTYDKRIQEKESDSAALIEAHQKTLQSLRDQLDPLTEQRYEVKEEINSHNNLIATANKGYNEESGELEDLAEALRPYETWLTKKCAPAEIKIKDCKEVQKRIAVLKARGERDQPFTEEEVRKREEILREEREALQALTATQREVLKAIKEIEDQIIKVEEEIANLRRPIEDMRSNLADLKKWDDVVSGRAPDANLAALLDQERECEEKTERLNAQIASLRIQHDDNLAELSRVYDVLCKNVIGPDATGNILFKENEGLVAELKQRASFDSPGIDPLKVILFDLAALVFGAEGYGHGISFLVHDSPREADLGWSLYSSFLRVARQLEDPLGGQDDCAFQYVVTTTTMPPKSLQDSPYCILKLDASKEDGKLLKRDFGG